MAYATSLTNMKTIRIGYGFDVHRLSEGYPLYLGGVLIEHSKGLVGHSDADVLIHAICDALLGAIAAGDIGSHFPPTDEQYRGIDSKILLAKVMELISQAGYQLGNLDATVAAEAPKLRPHIDRMRSCLAELLQTDIANVSVKATTTEGLGYTGRGEGVAAYVSVLLFPL